MKLRLVVAAFLSGALVGFVWPVGGPQTGEPVTRVGQVAAPVWVPSAPVVAARADTRRPSRDRDRGLACHDDLARLLHRAGFRGAALRTGWAIVMRESRGVPLDESSPWYSGALGIWQVQTSAHSGKPWWSRSVMLDPLGQSRAVYLHLSARGTDFRHWGIGAGGTVDATFYGGWSGDQVWRWIAEPFFRYWREWPCGRP
jgi:hypothetical protein